ncbi:hypothetical protein [Polaromonas hydrogenivorans]|uniref:Uncharacterized protein n=1 Tax=Polaromonas hydrogenivorans TaxID=335476 RepID=A0AAU7LY04_9BURK
MREAVIVPSACTPLTKAHCSELNSTSGTPEHRAHRMAYGSMASISGNATKPSLRNRLTACKS